MDYAFADTIRLHHGNAGEGKLLRHIQTTTLEAKRPMTWQGTKGKGDDEIRSVAAQEFNDLVPVMVQWALVSKGCGSVPSPQWGLGAGCVDMQTSTNVCTNRGQVYDTHTRSPCRA